MREETEEIEEIALYSHFESILDCEECGNEIRIEGDVHSGEILDCPECERKVRVVGR